MRHSIKKAIVNNPNVLMFIAVLSFLIGIIGEVIKADGVIAADVYIANLLAIFRNVEVTQIFLWITLLGKWQVILVFIFAAAGILWLWRRRAYIIPLFLTIGGSEIFTWLGKIAIHRPRPNFAVYIEDSFSFPSGHAAIAIAFYGFLTYLLICKAKHWKAKISLFFAGSTVIFLIGFSRLYLGVHYASDVLAGYLIGGLWLIIGIGVLKWLKSRKDRKISG